MRNRIAFDEDMTVGENIVFMFRCVCNDSRYAVAPLPGYFWRQTRDKGLRDSSPRAAGGVITSLVNGLKSIDEIMLQIPFLTNNPLARDSIVKCFYGRMPSRPMDRLRYETKKLTPQSKLDYVVLNILDHCNLNCKGCDHFASIAKKRFIPFETIAQDVKRFSEIMNGEVNRIGIMGGEPLLHPELVDIINVTRKYFPRTLIQLDTNGILLLKQSDAFWTSCRDNKVVVTNTKYPINLDFDKMQQTCKDNGVEFKFYGNTGEVVKTLFKLVMDLDGRQDPKKAFSRCHHANNCNLLMEGRLYPCTVAPNIHIFNERFGENLELTPADWLDIYDESITQRDVLNFCAKPIPFCRYCNVDARSHDHPWMITRQRENEWVLSECEKHPEQAARISTPKKLLRYEVHLVEHCNLNCRGCFHFSSIADEEFLDVEEYARDCRRLSQLAGGEASEILLMGGEPLLHKRVEDFFEITRGNFPNAAISLITNGVLLPKMSETFWSSCRRNRIMIKPTKYPIGVDYAQLEKLAASKGVPLFYFNDGSVTKTLSTLPIDPSGSQDKEDNFYGCYRANHCITLEHGRLYTCIIPAHIRHYIKKFGGKFPDFKTDGIDIYRAQSLEELMRFLTKPIEACRYCDRMHVRDGLKWASSGSKSDVNYWDRKTFEHRELN